MTGEPSALERAVLEAFQRGDPGAAWNGADEAAWTAFGLRCLLEASRVLRTQAGSRGERVEFKPDGSPVTSLERAIERDIRERLRVFAPAAAFVGEETGGPCRARASPSPSIRWTAPGPA